MEEQSRELEKMSPDALMHGFSRTRFGRAIVIAVVAHVVVIGATSVGYVWRLFNPPPPKTAKADADAAESQPESTENTEPAAAGVATTVTATAAASTSAVPESAQSSKVMQEITEVAPPESIPKLPDIGISIDETNPF